MVLAVGPAESQSLQLIYQHLIQWQAGRRSCGQVGDQQDLRSVIEKNVQAEASKAQAFPDQLERSIRSEFMNGMVLGVRLQTKLPAATTDEDGWCVVVEEK
jgi:hypothetical protein